MSVTEPFYPDIDRSVLPLVSKEIFKSKPEAKFWIGRVAVGDTIEHQEYFEGSAILRANVYIDEMNFLEPQNRNELGFEIDEDDNRSTHFAVIENGSIGNKARVVGVSRLIRKGDNKELLPVERLFPEVFLENPAEVGAVEVSRFIARHEKEYIQHLIALSSIRTMTHYSVSQEVAADYCVIEEPLWRLLTTIGLPMKQLAPPKMIEEYNNTFNMAVRIDPREVVESVTRDKTGKLPLTKFFKGEEDNLGLGYYSSSLLGIE